MMTGTYTPPESHLAQKRQNGEKLTTLGVMLAAAGAVGIVFSTILKVVWLGIFGGPIGALSWLAVFAGIGCFVTGFLMIKSARENKDR